MLSGAASTASSTNSSSQSSSENASQPVLVPMSKEASPPRERRATITSNKPDTRDDITDDSSIGSSIHESSYLGGKLSSFGSTSHASDSESNLIEWDASAAQLLYDSSADAVMIVTQEGVIKALNMSAQHMFGYFHKEVAGRNVSMMFPKHYRKQLTLKLTEISENTRPGDLEEVREAYCERKAGDSFIATLRIVNNLASTTSEPGFIISIHDDSEFINLQSRAQRRLQEMMQQVEAKEAMLLKAQAIEEREMLQQRKLKEHQMHEKKTKKKEFLKELREMNDMKMKLMEKHDQEQEELVSKDMELKEQIEGAKDAQNDTLIHKLELERLRLLFEREAKDLSLRQNIQSEEVKLNHLRIANEKAEKQLKEAQQQKLDTLREAQILRRFRKEQRNIMKSQKMRQLSELRENQIEELEALKRRHRQELFTLANDMRKATRRQKYEQERMAAELIEQQTKFSAEVQLAQQKEAASLAKAREREAEVMRVEQDNAARLLKQNQEEILNMLARRHEDEQRRFEEQLEEKKHYELLAQNCSDMISLHNVETMDCRYVSPSCESLLGYSQEEMEHINYNDLVHADNRNEAREAVRRLLEIARGGARELPSCQQVFRMRRRDGSNVWVERAVKVFRTRRLKPQLAITDGPNGTADGAANGVHDALNEVLALSSSKGEDSYQEEMEILFTTRNITQRKDMEEQQRRAEKLQAAATTAAQVKRDFLAFIGHECRNPLNALFNVTDFLHDTGLSDQQSKYVGIIKQCCGDMLRILNDLLDLSKIEAGKIEIEVLPFNLRAVIADAVTTMQAQAAKKELEVTFHVEPDVPKILMGDATRIRQILLNMISNGIKFTEKGKVHVAVAVHDEIDEDNLFVLFKVIDTGIGIDEDVVSKLFTMYGQATVSDYRKYGGSGIGLRLCALLVQQSMGGNIGIESVKGEGTTVWFTVPFCHRITGKLSRSSSTSDTPGPSSLAVEDSSSRQDIPSTDQSTSQEASTIDTSNTPLSIPLTSAVLREHDLRQQQEVQALERTPSPSRHTPHFADPELYEQWTSPTLLANLRRGSMNGVSPTIQPLSPPKAPTQPPQQPQLQQQPLQLQPLQPQQQPPQPQQQPSQPQPTQHAHASQPPPPQSTTQPAQQVAQPQPRHPSSPQVLSPPPPQQTQKLQESTPHPQPPSSLPQPTPQNTPLTSTMEKPMIVLVVDDIPLNRDIAVALLSKENCKCDVAVDGVEAVAAFKQKRYDLVLLDIQMPRMTGTEAIYYIREYERTEGLRRVPVVAISGNVQPAEQASYFQAGMDGFLAKPFKRDEFLRMLNKYKPGPEGVAPETPKQIPPARRANSAIAGLQSATVPINPTPENTTYPHTGPPTLTHRTKQYKTNSPIPFMTARSEPEFSFERDEHDEGRKAGATNRRASVSALTSPYNVISLNASAELPPLPEEYEETPSTKTYTAPYPHTPVPSHEIPYKELNGSRRASSPSRVSFTAAQPFASVASPRSTHSTSPREEEEEDTGTPSTPHDTTTPPHGLVREYVSQEFAASASEHHNVRILVADNSMADRQVYKRMLAQYQADIVASGTSTLDLFDTNNYDVILLDCNLDDMEIRDLVSQIRRKEQLSNQHVPIVLVCTTAKQEEEFRGVGVSQILIKGRGFINRNILLQALLRSVNIIPGDAPLTIQPKDLFDTSELVDSLFLAQISRSNFFTELFQLFIGCTEKIVVNMNKYLREHDARGLVIEAHNCSSISANIGAVWLSRLASELRVAAAKVQGKELPPEISNLVERVINGVDLTLEYLEKCRIISRSPQDGKWIMKKVHTALAQSEEIYKDANAMGKTRVLVVDDMPMTQFIVTTLLNKLHFSCCTVSNGVEAVAEIKKNNYDLILMDNYMDQMTGIEAVGQIREFEKGTGKRTPVIGLTSLVGNNTDEVVPQLIKAGMDDVIFKPILRNSFLSRLEIWRPQLSDAFTWTLELDTTLLDELVQSAPTTITQAIPRILELSNRVSTIIVHALGDHNSTHLLTPISELIELCSMLGASRLAEVAKILYQYISTREVSEFTAHRLVQIYAVVRASTVDCLNKYTASRNIETSPDTRVSLSPSSATTLALSSPPPPPLNLNQSSSTTSTTTSSSFPPASSTTSQIRVLVADDQPLTRMVIKSMVSKAFPQVVIDMAENGELAVAKADTTWYDLILMDIGMPKMDGYKASQLIRASEAVRRTQPMPIVAITAGSVTKANDAMAYQEAGMNELIHKPFSNAKLTAIFNKYIFEKDMSRQSPSIETTFMEHSDALNLNYPDEMILNSEILDMLRGLGILERTVETFEKHSKELLQRARNVDPGVLQKRSFIRQNIHALKGISLNSGASMLGRMCDDLERVVLDCDKETVVKMLDMIETEFARAMTRYKALQ